MYASELSNFFVFSHSKTAKSFNILLVFQILCLRTLYIFRSRITFAIVQSMQMLFITYGMTLETTVAYTDN